MDENLLLTKVEVFGLLDRLTHKIEFPRSDDFVIVHGPNGVGKTLLLELISAVSWPINFSIIYRVPFDVLKLEFSDGSSFSVKKSGDRKPSSEIDETSPGKYADEEYQFIFSLQEGGASLPLSWTPRVKSDLVGSRRVMSQLMGGSSGQLSNRDRWIRNRIAHNSTVDLFSEFVSTWEGDLPEVLESMLVDPVPEVMRDFLGRITVHSIDTHRLLGLSASDERPGRSGKKITSTKVEEFAKDLARRLAQELSENSRTSQELDRTYPQRLLESPVVDVSEQEIRERYDSQNELRRQLGDISLVDDRSSVIEIPETMERWQRSVLWTYLGDTEDKLATFKDILDRVSRLQEIVNSKFLFKRLEIDRERGFRLMSDTGKELDLASLSSGEQHELVLIYDLLFNVPPGALVLIDEPEISLHVSWQKGFLSDILKISSLVNFRTIVATHSPQIAGKWADRMVLIGPNAE